MIYKVVVIDDKPLIRKAIVKTIDWEKLKCNVVGQANDGVEGKQIIEKTKPDIIITDIKMPEVNGLQLAEFAKPILPHTKIILITGYQEFEYAQKALKLGIFDFILKPIKNQELFEIIKSAIKSIEKEANKKTKIEKLLNQRSKLQKQHKETIPLLQSKFISDIINQEAGNIDNIEIKKQKQKILFSRYNAILIRLNDLNYSDIGTFNLLVRENLKKIKKNFEVNIIDTVINRDIVAIFLFDSVVNEREAKTKMRKMCYGLCKNISIKSKTDYSIAIDSVYKSLSNLPDSYRKLCVTMDMQFFKSKKENILFVDEVDSIKSEAELSIFNELQKFYGSIEEKSNKDIGKNMHKLFNQIISYSRGNVFVAKSLLAEICVTSARYCYVANGDKDDLSVSIDEALLRIENANDMNQAYDYLKVFIEEIKNQLEDFLEGCSPVVKDVLRYINNSYAENISLEIIGEMFSVNPSYLSRIIKQETGNNFIDILSKVRINKAKKLLKNSQNRVNEIADMVGYKDYTYFYQVFKKIEGISPTEYKNK